MGRTTPEEIDLPLMRPNRKPEAVTGGMIRLILSGAACFAICHLPCAISAADLPPIPQAAPPPAFELTLAWDEPTNAVTGYILHWGTASRTYTNQMPFAGSVVISGGSNQPVSVSNITRVTVSNLSYEAERYYFALTATNPLGLESDFSNEAVYVLTNEPPLTNTIVTLHACVLSAPAPAGPWSIETNIALLTLTNPSGSKFFKPGPLTINSHRF